MGINYPGYSAPIEERRRSTMMARLQILKYLNRNSGGTFYIEEDVNTDMSPEDIDKWLQETNKNIEWVRSIADKQMAQQNRRTMI